MTNPTHNQANNLLMELSLAPSLSLFAFFQENGQIGINGTSLGFADGTEVNILVLDEMGNSTALTVTISGDSFTVANLDAGGFIPGNLTIIANSGEVQVQENLLLEEIPPSDPIIIDPQPVLDELNQLSIQGKAPSLNPGDEVRLVIRDRNGTSVTATAEVQADGRFSVEGISTQGLMDGTLFIDVLAQTDAGAISVVNAANLELMTNTPEGQDRTLALNEDTPLALGVADFGYDSSEGFNLTGIKIAGLPAAGSLQLNGVDVAMDDFVSVAQLNAGQLLYRPPLNANGNAFANFKFKVMDDRTANNEDRVANTITFNVTPVNDAPVNTVPGAQTATEDTAKAITGLSVNDVDGNLATVKLTVLNGTLGVSLAAGASISGGANNSATLTLSGTQAQINAALGTVSYQGNANYAGEDTLTMVSTDSDGTPLSDTDTVAITVTGVNDAPVNTVPGLQTTNEDTNKVIAGLQVADVDVGSNTMTVTLAVTHGTLTLLPGTGVTLTGNNTASVQLSGTLSAVNALLATANAVTYKPTANYFGSAELTMTSSDGTLSDTDTVVITVNPVNDAPTGTNKTITMLEDGSRTLAAGDFGFADAADTPANTLSAVIITSLPTAGTLRLSGSPVTLNQSIPTASLANLVYTPAANGNGTGYATIGFKVVDNGGTANGGQNTSVNANTLTFNVTAVNDAPVNTVPGAQTASEDTAKAIAGLSVNDVDGNLATVKLTVLNGTLGVSLAGGASVSAGANNSATLTLSGTQAQINAALGTVSYKGNANYAGSDTLTMLSTDSAGTPLSDTDTVAITVTGVNDAPVNTMPGLQTTNEDTNKVIAGLQVADVDVGSNTMTVTLAVTHGTLTLLPGTGVTLTGNNTASVQLSGTLSAVNALLATANAVTYKPTANYFGSSELTMTSSDGTLSDTDTVAITVDPVNDAPVLADTVLTTSASNSAAAPVGTVGSLVSSFMGGVTDPDGVSVPKGMAITAVDTTKGTLYYSTNGGGAWTEVTQTLSDSNALLLGSDSGNRVFFRPHADVGQGSFNAFTIRAWDQTQGAEATLFNITATGGATAFSTATDTVALQVIDGAPPILVGSNPSDNGYITALGNNIVLNFNENVVKGTGAIALYRADGTLVESFDVATSGLVTGWGTPNLTLNPSSDLLAGTGYYIQIAPTAVKDAAGNAYAGIADNTTLNFSTADGNGGFTVATAYSGAYRVSNAGDVNGDGYEDVIVGNPSGDGAAYVVYGNAQGLAVDLAGGTIAADKGFKIVGVAGSNLGTSVSSAGDINGDGFADVLVGAVGLEFGQSGGTTSAEGAAYVVYGSAAGSTVDLANFQASQGVVFVGQTGEALGRVSLAGDVNGDGLSDLLLGTINSGNLGSPGRAYVIYGQSSGMDHNFYVDPTLNPSQGMVLTGNGDSGGARQIGWFPSSAGDFNGDGYADMIFPSYAHDDAYIIFGGPTSLLSQDVSSSTLGDAGYGPGGDLDSLVAMGRGIKLHGDTYKMGYKVHGLGDVNGDGLGDVALVSNAGSGNFNVRVVYGTNANVNNIYLSSTASPQGFRINSDAADSALLEVSSAGDMNGDGLADILVSGRKLVNAQDWSYVVYGSSNASNLNLTNLTIAADRGFRLQGTALGNGHSTAGDFNGDGLSDLIFGNDDTGSYSVVMGGTQWVTGAVNGAGAFSGSASDEALIGSEGNDTMTGGGGVDRFFAGKGDDTIVITASDVANLQSNTRAAVKASVDGGTGFNTLRLSGGANLDLNLITNVGAGGTEESSRIENISRIDLATDSAANVLKIAAKDVGDMTGLNQIRIGTPSEDGQTWTNLSGTPLSTITRLRQMVIEGGGNDTVVLNTDEGVWANVGIASNGSHTYTVYQNDANTAQVLVRQGVTVRTQAPTLLWTSPADNDFVNTANLGQDITLRFSETVVQGQGQIRLWNLTDNALVESFDVASSSLVSGWNSNTLTINPSANFLPGKQYTVLVSDYAVHNSAGVAYAGVEDWTTFNFNTQSNDDSYALTASYLGAFSTRRTLVDVSSAGDFNGDGYDDLLVMAPGNTTEPTGFAYVVFGNAEGTGQHLNDLAGTLPPERGVKITGDFANMSGSVSSLGDINGDGFADVLIGSNSSDGKAYVVYGRANAAALNFSDGNIAASDGFKITGNSSFRLGGNVSNAGDFNGDGINDFILGAWTSNAAGVTNSGSAYVIYGKTNGSNLSLAADGSIDAADGIRLTGAAFNAAGRSVSGAGDVNGDGLADVIVGANGSSTTSGGGGYVIFGGATGGDMTTLTNNGMGFKINAFTSSGERVGTVVSSLGDVNGDGLADVALSTDSDQSTSSVYVVYGRSTPSAVNLTTGNAIQASDGFRISAATSLGVSLNQVSSAGDVNGDGLADMIVGSRNGTAFVVYGNSLGANLSLNNATIAASNGFKLKYETANTANSAISVSSAGDLNGDGLGDLVIGDRGDGADGSYKIVFGGTQWISNAVVGNGAVTGTAASEAILGSDDNDTLVGGGGVDRFFAGKGDDTIVLTSSDHTNLSSNAINGVKASVQGGGGYDSIRLSGGVNLFMPSISNVGAMGLEENSRIESIERIDMATDTLANSLSLQSRDVRDMAGMNLIRTGSVSADGKTWTNVTGTALSGTTKFHQLVVDGGSNDNLTLGTDLGFWSVAGTVSNGTHTYTVYQNTGGNAQVLVRAGVVVTNNDSVAPVVLDLNRDGDLAYSQMLMDINSDGQMDLTAWAAAEDGVLVWDKFGDGLVHDQSQYAFAQYAGFAGATDLQGLAEAFDSNRDGVFDVLDALYSQFAVWQDLDQDGTSDEGEVRSLADWGISGIGLNSDGVVQAPALGVQEAGRSTAQMADGTQMVVADAAFAYQSVPELDLAGFVARAAQTSQAQRVDAPDSVKLFLYDMIQGAQNAEQGDHGLFAANDAGMTPPESSAMAGYSMDLLAEQIMRQSLG